MVRALLGVAALVTAVGAVGCGDDDDSVAEGAIEASELTEPAFGAFVLLGGPCAR